MQISLNIQDSYYNQFMALIKSLPKNAIEITSDDVARSYDDGTVAYMKTEQFQKDKAYFQEALKEIESGEAELITQEKYDTQMKSFTSGLKA